MGLMTLTTLITTFFILIHMRQAAQSNDLFKQEIAVLGTWSTFSSLKNMRCFCSYVTQTITESFYVNVSLTSPALFHGAWIAKRVKSSRDDSWHLLKNQYHSYPPEIELWFDLRYEYNVPQPTGVCIWSFKDPRLPMITTDTTVLSSDNTTYSYLLSSTAESLNTTHTQDDDGLPRDHNSNDNDGSIKEITTEEPVIASCLCPCSCHKKSQEEIDAMIQDILNDLRISKNNTALARRKLSSASDKRWVCRGIGFVGILVMTFVFGSIALADYKKFLNSYRLFVRLFKIRN